MGVQALGPALTSDRRPSLDHLEWVDGPSLRKEVKVLPSQRREVYGLPRMVSS